MKMGKTHLPLVPIRKMINLSLIRSLMM
ncbi:hypothetical protein Patl1_02433 [Pistacia atlantica]|uniref:Uncharacterized protein n=1 Tax=Pistacia atlantica TaxID=434234 RepID=A0ACC1C461_9ROSI|nr:hypothetical protein Patl1_02433 [Pistacia atlantica]